MTVTFSLRAALAVLMLSAGAHPAAAYVPKARHIDDVTKYVFVADTPLPGPDGRYALCIAYTQSPLATGVKRMGYALVPNRCESKTSLLGLVTHEIAHVVPLTAGMIATYQRDGVLPADLPPAPELPLRERLKANFLWLALLCPLAGIGVLRVGLRLLSTPAPPRNGLADGLALALWSVAHADGQADARERALIERQLDAVGGSDFDPACVPAACVPVNLVEIGQDFRSAARGLSESQRGMVLRSAAALATCDKPASEAERAVISRMAQAFGLPSPV